MIEIRNIPDPVATGVAAGWKVASLGAMTGSARIDCDVVIVGTGAGGGTAAEILTAAGLDVVLIEEGPLRSQSRFPSWRARSPTAHREAETAKAHRG